MAEFKFFNIGKANAEIIRLETELAGVRAELAAGKENATAIEASAEATQAELTQAKADLVTAKASISSITAAHDAVKAELKTANEKLANPSQQVKEAASRKAMEITQGQGQPPVAGAATGEAAAGDVLAQYKAIKDPQARVTFYRKNKAAIDSAYKAMPAE